MGTERDMQRDWLDHHHRARRMQSRTMSIYSRLAWRRLRSALRHYGFMFRSPRHAAVLRVEPA